MSISNNFYTFFALSHNKYYHRVIIPMTCLRFTRDVEDQRKLDYDAVSFDM